MSTEHDIKVYLKQLNEERVKETQIIGLEAAILDLVNYVTIAYKRVGPVPRRLISGQYSRRIMKLGMSFPEFITHAVNTKRICEGINNKTMKRFILPSEPFNQLPETELDNYVTALDTGTTEERAYYLDLIEFIGSGLTFNEAMNKAIELNNPTEHKEVL